MNVKGFAFERPSWNGWRIESLAFARCFYPHRNNNTLTKLISMIFVTGWVAITVGISYQSFDVVQPAFYGLYTAIVFLIVGRIWDIEVDTLLPGNITDNEE